MKKQVIDASTLLAYMQGETGSVEAGKFCKGAYISAVNLAEVFQKSNERGRMPIAQAIVLQAGIEVVPFESKQAAIMASIYPFTLGRNISLADRACMVLGKHLGLPVVTADTGWKGIDVGVEFVFFR